MAILNDKIQEQVKEVFQEIQSPVRLIIFSQDENSLECQLCMETRQLVEEIGALSDQVSVEVRDFVKDVEMVEAYQIDKIPAIAVLRGGDEPKDFGIRFYGIPSGYEFSSLIEDILMVSSGNHGLSAKTLAEVEKLTEPVRIQVFVTPT